MIIYGRPPLMRAVRTYEPILSPDAYEIDMIANEKKLHLDKLTTVVRRYLEQTPRNNQEKKHQKRLEQVLKKQDDVGWVRKTVNTDKKGWRQIQKKYVF